MSLIEAASFDESTKEDNKGKDEVVIVQIVGSDDSHLK